ncbi:hypothetical protein OCU04_002338 [Sclerotinia nivalis]|uniref:Uncharacterized protein n=1 Tax=Sclerotinia nivalis TaxID=352851 RepID=A0A9X0ATF0_9HELO|nr:hypothetical protein OCU04_002338 [Sclerotinia nivalis]
MISSLVHLGLETLHTRLCLCFGYGMAVSSSVNCDHSKMNSLLEGILEELKAIRHERLGVTPNQSPSLPDKKIAIKSTPKQVSLVPIPMNSFVSTKIMSIYENDEVTCRSNDGVLEELPRRTGTIDEQEKWSLSVGNAWNIPEDGRFKLTFSKRSLLSLSSEAALKMLEEVHKEEIEIPKWFKGGKTRIVDVFDDETTKVYTVGPDVAKVTGSGNIAPHPINYDKQSQVASTSGGSAPSPNIWSGPWRRMISIYAPETRSRCLVHDLDVPCLPSKQCLPKPGFGFGHGYSLELCFYQIVTIPTNKAQAIPWGFWKNGMLHTEGNECSISSTPVVKKRKLLESQYHLQAIRSPACRSISNIQYWTLLEMNPATFNSHDSIQNLTIASKNMLFCVFYHAYSAVSKVANRWKEILEYFDQSIDDKLAFLDPDYHDKLLFDDELLSRSKKYFWAISTLKELRTNISHNILQVKQLIGQETNETPTEEESRGIKRLRAMLCSELQKIEDIASKLKAKQEEAIYLRDGFIGASLLVETRNSSIQFNQNIKFLVYINIFFLSLSFCMV